MIKVVYGIRHAEGWHNILFSALRQRAYTDYQDCSLTVTGMLQAKDAPKPKGIQVVYVSPLTRTLQTSQLIFPNTPTIALECLKEYPQHSQQCNRRSSRSLLKCVFPAVNFDDLKEEEQPWPNPITYESNLKTFKEIVKNCPYSNIAVVTHSTWLKYCMTNKIESLPELKHCVPYKLNIN